MEIMINNTLIEVLQNETILEAAYRMGVEIPSLCYAKGSVHKSSCMVCAVKNSANGQIIPSCTTLPTAGMQIDTESDEVKTVRRLSLELLLSDHRADCEAPCSMVCKQGLDVERMLAFYDVGLYEKAYNVIEAAFALPQLGCTDCKALCEKSCRRGSVDEPVAIRAIIQEVVDKFATTPKNGTAKSHTTETVYTTDKTNYKSLVGRFTSEEKERLQREINVPSRCLHCACSGRTDCKLRQYATAEGIKRSRYGNSSQLSVLKKQHIKDNIWFESAKCIRCGICVYNSTNGFTFRDRGFGMEVMIPCENYANVNEHLTKLCPTGAIYKI